MRARKKTMINTEINQKNIAMIIITIGDTKIKIGGLKEDYTTLEIDGTTTGFHIPGRVQSISVQGQQNTFIHRNDSTGSGTEHGVKVIAEMIEALENIQKRSMS